MKKTNLMKLIELKYQLDIEKRIRDCKHISEVWHEINGYCPISYSTVIKWGYKIRTRSHKS